MTKLRRLSSLSLNDRAKQATYWKMETCKKIIYKDNNQYEIFIQTRQINMKMCEQF